MNTSLSHLSTYVQLLTTCKSDLCSTVNDKIKLTKIYNKLIVSSDKMHASAITTLWPWHLTSDLENLSAIPTHMWNIYGKFHWNHWLHSLFPTTSSASPIPTAAVSGRRCPHSWWSDKHGCPLLAIVCWWLEAASAARRHLSFNADCFPPQNSSLFPVISFLTVFGF